MLLKLGLSLAPNVGYELLPFTVYSMLHHLRKRRRYGAFNQTAYSWKTSLFDVAAPKSSHWLGRYRLIFRRRTNFQSSVPCPLFKEY